MFTSKTCKAVLLLFASLLLCHTHARAQSGRKSPTQEAPPGMQPAPAPTPADNTRYEKVRVVQAEELENFVKALNEQGRVGYRLEKTVSYDYRRYAAVLHLDPGHTYDYVADPVPDDPAKYGDLLGHHARRGYGLAHTYATTQCRFTEVPARPYDPSSTEKTYETVESKGNILLFMRRDADERQTKEYMLFRGIFALDGGQKQEIQSELDAAPVGFRPVGLLFAPAWDLFFNLTVVAERDLNEPAPQKGEYRLVKEVFGFEEKINRLAAAGSRYVGGGRHQFVKIALLEGPTAATGPYTFLDDYDAKGFAREAAAGNRYVGLLLGELKCTAGSQYFHQKLVFARGAGGGPAPEYKLLQVADRKLRKQFGLLPEAAVSELRRHLAEGFRVRDLYYVNGLYAVLERPAAPPPAPRLLTSSR